MDETVFIYKMKTKQQQNKSRLSETNKKILLEIYEYNFKN